MKILYEAKATSTGGRDGQVKSSDGVLNLALRTPQSLGGPGGAFSNPEQLFAAGYSACYLNAIYFVARQRKIVISPDASVEGTVGIGQAETGFALAVELKVSLPGTEPSLARELMEAAHSICPYSNATRGNVQVQLTLV
jgi:Ohr subfamily peroxiredoxin